MIRNQWYAVLESQEVPPGKPVGVTRLGEKLVFWRTGEGKVVCMRDLCPHIGARLSQGKVRKNALMCPFHGFEYAPTGECVHLPAYGKNGVIPKALRAATYPAHEAWNFIWIWWGEGNPEPVAPKYFDSIDETFSYASFRQHWQVHYSRMAENQLDVSHLAFVHHNTIGRGGRAVVDGPIVRLENDLLEVWVSNRLDDGIPARKAEELPPPARHPFLQFRFPNLWHNWISDDVRITISFVPVDEENSLLYGRFYQKFMRVPILRNLVNLFGAWSSIYIANQDKAIVSNQFPKKTDLKMGEKIMQSDRAILTYRQHRSRLQQAALQTQK
ncbi:MAG TPA: aromatic ring-hydroxylating dioxygenase subunit alpha [Anaerolineaceae bacterium]|nr:aromatic ring-hydroxylating dioxygenase subunit alpha [Anaerolineaceae bacterium]HQF44413.1 aromatic ring-hydroxylating dioxygenase subunit alpha [Anaerolineaceae bacterium]HQH34300.1 aromatic ring-hydroxylating dioxygenase subunit alpha [Anaerolineaceae bacterium]HQJ03732.1 aromatic ring-hydroxylating dioxygenase subunit alpha [Anaerolineaceae bacterium]